MQSKADSLEVQWPSGHVDKLTNISAGQTVTIQEGKGVMASRLYAKPSIGKGTKSAGLEKLGGKKGRARL
jgi:hypothetical protein